MRPFHRALRHNCRVDGGAAVSCMAPRRLTRFSARTRIVPPPLTEGPMLQHELTAQHIDIAETFIRLYVFLTQYIDSCESKTVNQVMRLGE